MAQVTRIVLKVPANGIEQFILEPNQDVLSSGLDEGGVWFNTKIKGHRQGRPAYFTTRVPWTNIAWIEEE